MNPAFDDFIAHLENHTKHASDTCVRTLLGIQFRSMEPECELCVSEIARAAGLCEPQVLNGLTEAIRMELLEVEHVGGAVRLKWLYEPRKAKGVECCNHSRPS